VHTANEAEGSIKRAQDFGFENLSIDLIYGSPTSNLEIWKENLNKTIALEVPHISSYALTVEPKTALKTGSQKEK
jgi:oxygen-independent coproporphyrinogen-3 oxidase